MAYTPDFELVHIGVNCADEAQAAECAHKFELLFQLAVNPAKESADARFTGTQIEWMKKPGRGEHGHLALATADLPAGCQLNVRRIVRGVGCPRPAATWKKRAFPLTRRA